MKSKIAKPFKIIAGYINEKAYGGILLILATIVAMIWANSSFYGSYHELWHEYKVGFVWGNLNMVTSLHHWINDGLMALFFFTVGLEIKREIMSGELSSLKKASLPLAAAIGGMIIPATVYAIITVNYPEYISGWGIPMATDIAFALGLLAMLGDRVPLNLKIFLTALAIADDLGAVMVIALFYTETINHYELLYAGFFLTVLVMANLAGVRRTIFYGIIGFSGVWIAFIYSGVHATIAGVLIALTIPAKTKISIPDYINELSEYKKKFKTEGTTVETKTTLLSADQVNMITQFQDLNQKAITPLQKLEHALHPVMAYLVLPLFALSNAGVHIDGKIGDMLIHPISLGIIAGLLLGKFIGISLFAKLMVKLKLSALPENVTWNHIYGAGFLAGIGFTMSIFISELAFSDDSFKQIAKVGIMVASALSAILGMLLLRMTSKKRED